MRLDDLKDGVAKGALAGIIWGWLSFALNSFTNIFEFEGSFASDLASFTFGGAVFGIFTGGFLSVVGGYIPSKSVIGKAVAVSAVLWIILKAGGTLLSVSEPDRYHIVTAEAAQGFVLSIILGLTLGLLWKRSGGDFGSKR